MAEIVYARRAKRDLRRIGPGPEARRIVRALDELAAGAPNLDVKALQGRAPWLRLRVGDWRVLYREIGEGDLLVGRIVPRGDLERAVDSL